QVLGGVDDLAGDPEQLAEDVRRAAREAGQRPAGVGQAVGGLVDRAVAAEGDDDAVAVACGLAADLGGVTAGLGLDGLDPVARGEGVDDEVAQAIRNGRREGVDDHQRAALVGLADRRQRGEHAFDGRLAGTVAHAPATPRRTLRYRAGVAVAASLYFGHI